MGKGQSRPKVEIVNLIEIDGRPPVLFDSIPEEEKKRVSLLMNERIMTTVGYRRRINS